MKRYNNPNTQVLTIKLTLCQAASPAEGGYHPLGHGGEATGGQSGAM